MASHPHPGVDARTHWLAERTDTAPSVIEELPPGEREELARRVANEQAGINPDDDTGGDSSDSATQSQESQAAAVQSESDSRGIAAGSRDGRDDSGGSLGDHVRSLTDPASTHGTADRDDRGDPPVFAPMASDPDDRGSPVYAPNVDQGAEENRSGDGSGYTDSLGVLRRMDDR